MKNLPIAAFTLIATLSAATQAAELTLPNPEQARTAFATMFGDAKLFERAQLAIGTCLALDDAPHPGQVSCTISVLSPGGSSEAQADFYLDAGQWTAQPATRQDLPFPDPKLANAHWTEPPPKP